MLKDLWKECKTKIAISFFLVFSFWWLTIQRLPLYSPIRDYFAGSYTIMALLGFYWGLKIMRHWGSYKSILGRAILMFSLGLLAQSFGQLSYTYYVVIQHIEVPYPSIGDIGYFGSIFFYLYGTILLAKASGISFSLKNFKNKIISIIVPLFMLTYSYFLFLKDYQFDFSKALTVFLDFGYPLGQTFYISITLLSFLLTKKLLGGIMKYRIVFIFFALLLQYLSDFNFLFQNSHESWITGAYGDYLYLIAYFVMTLALLQFNIAFKQLKET